MSLPTDHKYESSLLSNPEDKTKQLISQRVSFTEEDG
jgi:hypothetical protein